MIKPVISQEYSENNPEPPAMKLPDELPLTSDALHAVAEYIGYPGATTDAKTRES